MGASASVAQITTFLQGIGRSRGLRATLVADQAARCPVIDELLEREVDPSVMIVRVGFSPEPTISLRSLPAQSLCNGLEETEGAVDPQMALRWLAITLRRLSRLHPVLLVIDDLDQLGRASAGEFGLFLAALADETLSVLCRCDSVDPALRCVIERYLIEEMIARDVIGSEAEPVAAGDQGVGIRISMLGAIGIQRQEGPATPVRGERNATVLGVLVIDRMLADPLSYREFCRLASGCVDDHVRAQKIMNMGVKRLQEMLGCQAITRDAETPRLNPELVQVDLLEADALLREAVVTARSGPLMRSVEQLVAALDIIGDGVLFPELDGEMFSAARGDFMGHVRAAVVEIARQMLEEGEAGAIEAVLRRTLALLPEDEEIAGMLGEVYEIQSSGLIPHHGPSPAAVMQTETFVFATIPSYSRPYQRGAA